MNFPHPFSWRGARATDLGGRPNLLAHPDRLELVPLAMLRAEAAAAALQVHRCSDKERGLRLIESSVLNREIARRTGDAPTLAKAAAAAGRAIDKTSNPKVRVRARLEQCAASLLAGELFGDKEAYDIVEVRLAALADDGRHLSADDDVTLSVLKARVLGRQALASVDLNAAVEAAAAFDTAVERAIHLRQAPEEAAHAAAVRADRAEFTLGFGQRLKDATLLQQAAADLAALSAELDNARLPLTWTRVETLRASALLALGELEGSADHLGEAAAALSEASDHIDGDMSPLDAARTEHALGLALQALGEACDDGALFDTALSAFDRAAEGLERTHGLPLRTACAYDRAACIARRAERAHDLRALDYAEASFKLELKALKPSRDPLAWAVMQVAIARVYEARAVLVGDRGECADAAVALAAALEVFNEHGLPSLAHEAVEGLERLKAAVL